MQRNFYYNHFTFFSFFLHIFRTFTISRFYMCVYVCVRKRESEREHIHAVYVASMTSIKLSLPVLRTRSTPQHLKHLNTLEIQRFSLILP